MIPQEMLAITIKEPGGPEVLTPIMEAVPVPGAHEILIQVHAAGVNRPDVAQRQGVYPPPPGASSLPGLEVAGIVVSCGHAVTKHKIGDAVTALLAGGGYAAFAVADENLALPVPKGYSFTQAAALPETFFTVWSNVFDRAQLKSGETFLVHGGSSGIGTTAIQLAKSFGARVITTAGSEEKCQFCRKIGADLAINYKEEDFVQASLSFTKEKGVDVILDIVGGPYTNKNYKIAAIEGRIVQIAFLQGNLVTINLNYMMRKRLTHTGTTLRSRDIAFKGKIAQVLHEKVWPLLEEGLVAPIIDKTFALEDAAKAHAHMEQSAHMGKIILEVGHNKGV